MVVRSRDLLLSDLICSYVLCQINAKIRAICVVIGRISPFYGVNLVIFYSVHCILLLLLNFITLLMPVKWVIFSFHTNCLKMFFFLTALNLRFKIQVVYDLLPKI